jgi:helix-turn-helix protein
MHTEKIEIVVIYNNVETIEEKKAEVNSMLSDGWKIYNRVPVTEGIMFVLGYPVY